MVSRRGFMQAAVGAGAAGLVVRPVIGAQPGAGQPGAKEPPPKPPPLPQELVRECVIAGHGDLGKVKEMLAGQPGLLNATWDWGAGDWETALGGAGHMGRAEIARYLLGQGARIDLFVAAMLGELEIVKATLGATPAAKDSKGPHGITLMKHARAGGKDAERVVEYLKTLE